MSGSNSITPAQVLAALRLTGNNTAAAGQILNSSTLTGANLAALGTILANEVGSHVAQSSYGISSPVALGNSGYTIGINQLDFRTNNGAAVSLLSTALAASNQFSKDQLNTIIPAFQALKNSTAALNLPAATMTQVNSALQTAGAENAIRQNADASTLQLAANLANTVSQFSDPTLRAALTPGSATFDGAAYTALMDYSNQFHGVDVGGAMFNFLNTGSATFPGGASITYNLTDPNSSLASNIQAAEFATKYVQTGGVGAFDDIARREATQTHVGNAFDQQDSLRSDAGTTTVDYAGGENTVTDQSSGGFIANYVQSIAGQPVSKDGWYQEAQSGNIVNDASTYSATTGKETSETVTTETPTGTTQGTAQVTYGTGSTPSATVTVNRGQRHDRELCRSRHAHRAVGR